MGPQVVMKFGGTSVGSAEAMKKTARLIANEPRWPVVVVSALGGITNKLLEAADLALKQGSWELVFRSIVQLHHKTIEELELKPDLLSDLEIEMERWLHGVALLRELSPRVKDALLSLGERMSVRILAGLLSREGLTSKAWSSWELGLETNARHNRAEVLDSCMQKIRERFAQLAPREIPVVTGFIGRTVDGEITTLGRGGSDFSAAIFGAAIGVEEIQIWTDVPGFLRADPRVVKNPALIRRMSFDEAAELAYFGAKVLHPRTLEPARRENIPVRVLGTFDVSPEDVPNIASFGTLISETGTQERLCAISIRENVATLHVHSLRMIEAPGFLARVFEIFARHQISVDVVATSEVSVSMTLDSYEDAAMHAAIQEITNFARIELLTQHSIICLVGTQLHNDSSMVARAFAALARHQIPLHVISQGASRINLTLVTNAQYGRKAMQILHEEFFGPSH